MNTINNIVYPENQTRMVSVLSVRALPGYRLWLRFNDNETRTFDMTALLEMPCYQSLRDPAVFNQVYLDYGIPTWQDGTIDIAPETLYEGGTKC